jgi:hypothetical protein
LPIIAQINYFYSIESYYLVKRRIILSLSGLALIFTCCSWGFFAHYRINRLAVFTLPKGMSGFYKANIVFITQHAVSADKRRYVDSTEAPRHFLDADHYGKNPFSKIPQHWEDAVHKFTADTLDKYGTVPWAIQYNYYKLVKAFKAHDTTNILEASANLGHYVADAHVPLHLSLNYNGQLTHQTGIHALWESRIPELFGNSWNYYVGRARYIENPLQEAFKICNSSFKEVDSVLRFERMLNKSFPPDKKYVVEKHGRKTDTNYSEAYALAYQKMLNGMVQRRIRASILSVGSFWFSAWVDAGQPNLDRLIAIPLTITQKKKIAQEEALYKAGKVLVLAK